MSARDGARRVLATYRDSGALWTASLVADRVLPSLVRRLWRDVPVDAATLAAQVAAILRAWTVRDADAAIIVEHLLWADLHGIDSHGCAMLRAYQRDLDAGAWTPHAVVEVVHESETTALLDGGGGLGHVPSDTATRLAAAKCAAHGVAAVAVRNSGHFGAAGAYAALAARAGMIGLATTGTRVAARGTALQPPKMVLYMAEALPHGARAHIEDGFGIPVLSRYNAVESFKIGYFCERRTGFHVHEDLCHVRILGTDDRDVAPGEPGRIVLSNLVNRATVLLNYPIGDVAVLSPDACPCGRSQHLLTELEGRVEDVLALDDGRFVHPRAVWQLFKDDRDVPQYQLTQHETRRFALRLTTLDEAAFARARARALPALERLLAPEPTPEVQRGAELARGASDKFRAVASACAPRAAD